MMTQDEIKTKLQDEIINSLPETAHGLLKLSPRAGKTRIAINIIKRERPLRILWVTPNTELRDIDIPREFIQWDAEDYLRNTTIVCWMSLADVEGYYDKVIFDEYQYITEANVEPFFNGQIQYNSIIGLSGTHPKHQSKHELYRRLNLDILADMGIDEAVEMDLVSDYEITVVNVPMERELKEIQCGKPPKTFMQTEYGNYNYLHEQAERYMSMAKIMNRMRAIQRSPSKEKAAKYLIDNLPGRKLVFCGSIPQADRLSEHAYHSKNGKKGKENLKNFIEEKIDLLTCVNSGGTGTTYRNVDHFIIVQSDSDRRGNTTQKLARSLLKQHNYKAQIWFLCLEDTKDKVWVNSALESFNQDKISFVDIETLQGNNLKLGDNDYKQRD